MSEINGPKISVNQINFQGVQKSADSVVDENIEESSLPQITDFSDSKAEALGRSMLFKGVDNVNNDLKVLLDNPQIAENSDEIFETTYKVAQAQGLENPYEEASTASTVSI